MQDLDPEVQKLGARWLMCAGTVAVLLALFIYFADFKLTNSNREVVLGKTLKELRGAQTSLTTDVVDPRTTGN